MLKRPKKRILVPAAHPPARLSAVQRMARRYGYDKPERAPRREFTRESLIRKHERLIKTLLDPARANPNPMSMNAMDWREAKARGSLLKLTELTGESPAEIMRRLRLTEDEIARMGPFHETRQWHIGPAPAEPNPWD